MFFELATLWRELTTQRASIEKECHSALSALGPTTKPERRAEVLKRREKKIGELSEKCDAELLKINSRYPNVPKTPLAYPWLQAARRGPLTSEKEFASALEWLHFERHGEALAATVAKADAGDINALHKLQRTQEDAFRAQHGKGPLKQFQGDAYHRDLFQIGLCFGMEKLTSEELADCFEEYCPCGKIHDADALGKQRRRFIRELTEISAGLDRRPSSRPRVRR